MFPRDRALPFVRLGFVFVAAAVVASGFLLATLQAAYSPLALPLPSGPFEQLAEEAGRFAGIAFVFAALTPMIDDGANVRGLATLFGAGAFVKLAMLAFAAAVGMMAIQASDPRELAPRLFMLRMLADVLLLAALGWGASMLLRRRAAPGSSS